MSLETSTHQQSRYSGCAAVHLYGLHVFLGILMVVCVRACMDGDLIHVIVVAVGTESSIMHNFMYQCILQVIRKPSFLWYCSVLCMFFSASNLPAIQIPSLKDSVVTRQYSLKQTLAVHLKSKGRELARFYPCRVSLFLILVLRSVRQRW